MNHGGRRQGSGRRTSGPDSVQVNWRVSEKAKAWIVGQAKGRKVSVAAIVDELIGCYLSRIQSSISEAVASDPLLLPYPQCFMIERLKVIRCYEEGVPVRIDGQVLRVTNIEEGVDHFNSQGPYRWKFSFCVQPTSLADGQICIDVDLDQMSQALGQKKGNICRYEPFRNEYIRVRDRDGKLMIIDKY